MEDDASILLDGKTLANLRVVDLKLELEKRGLSKSGSKKDLVKRLKQQVEFEKLCEESKSTGDCDLKLELDADTEQNEFVQQYLAQQQKIYAQQKEVKRRVELEEIQKSGDEKESCDSSKGDDDKTEDEAEIEPENQKVEAVTNDTFISLASSKRAQGVKEGVFEDADSIRHPSVIKETRTQYEGIGGNDKGPEVRVRDEYETQKPIADVRDVEKDREKELSTAISSLLSVEKSRKEIDRPEDLSVAAGSGDGAVARTTHDDDREKDLATAVLSSLLVDRDVETEKNEAVPSRMELDATPSTRVDSNVVPSQMETSVVPSQIEADVLPSQVETDVVPSPMETDVVPSQMKTDVVPTQMESKLVTPQMEPKLVPSPTKSDMVPTEMEYDMVPSQTDSKVAITQLKTDGAASQVESKAMSSSQSVSDVASLGFREASVKVGDSSEKSVQGAVRDSEEMNVDCTVGGKDGVQSDAVDTSSDVKKTPVETCEISQAVEEEMNSKMDVTSVPYSLSEIQLPESPLNIVKPQSKSHSAKATESDEDVHSNGFDSKLKRSESGDLNGKKESADDKIHLAKGSDVENTKVSEKVHSDNDSGTDYAKSTKGSKRLQKDHSDTVIMKEAPKQRLKIKRDNVIVAKAAEGGKEPHGDKQDTTKDSVIETLEPEENQKLEPGECAEITPSTTYVSRKITLSSRKRSEEKTSDESVGKRSKWGSFAASRKAKQTVSISTDSLKTWFPDFKLLKEPTAELIPDEPPSPAPVGGEPVEVETPLTLEKVTEEPKVTAITRRLEPPPVAAEEEKPKVVAAETHAEKAGGAEPTRILFVRNLVRPFTLLQLKELLKETGKTVDGKFWIDKIKSKCFVTYETEEKAIKTRRVLNGARWPMSNPKILTVDFATEEDLSFHRSGAVDRPRPLPSPPARQSQEEPQREHRKPFDREARLRDRAPVREWDEGKVRQDSPPPPAVKQERTSWGDSEDKASKGADKDKKEAKRRVNEDTPAKLLDDLFQKTKATPCIYWLPLNQEQIKERAEQQRLVRAERERRDQENKRPRSKQRMRETDTRRSSTRSRSPLPRRR